MRKLLSNVVDKIMSFIGQIYLNTVQLLPVTVIILFTGISKH